MNGDHHRDLALCACHLAGVAKDKQSALIEGAGTADYLPDVRCSVPFHDMFPGTWGALCHFEPGYLWDGDRSLGLLEELGEAGLHLAGSTVSGTSAPMLRACEAQKGFVLSDFRFPSASAMGSHWSTFPAWSTENGRALHMVQDSCCPHHARGMLLWGHQDFEDALENLWDQHRTMIAASSDPKASAAEFVKAVRAERVTATTVDELIKSNAAWTREWFGQAHQHDECSITDCLAICVRAVASSIQAINLMTKG